MKNPANFTIGRVVGNFKIRLLIFFSATKLEKILQKTAESCGNFKILTTFAKKLKDRELDNDL